MACVRSSTRTVGVPSTQSRQVRHKPPRRFLALQRSQHLRFLPTTQVIARLFIMVTHMTTDVRGSITYNGFCHRLQTHSALCCSGHLGAAAGILLLCPWSAAVCAYGTSTTDDVCAYGTAPTDGILHTCRGGAFSRRHTWYEFRHCTESIQH